MGGRQQPGEDPDSGSADLLVVLRVASAALPACWSRESTGGAEPQCTAGRARVDPRRPGPGSSVDRVGASAHHGGSHVVDACRLWPGGGGCSVVGRPARHPRVRRLVRGTGSGLRSHSQHQSRRTGRCALHRERQVDPRAGRRPRVPAGHPVVGDVAARHRCRRAGVVLLLGLLQRRRAGAGQVRGHADGIRRSYERAGGGRRPHPALRVLGAHHHLLLPADRPPHDPSDQPAGRDRGAGRHHRRGSRDVGGPGHPGCAGRDCTGSPR